jgi:hypothetical protein
MVIKKALQHEVFIFVGILMVAGTFSKLVFGVHINSDWFWFIAGLALVLEGGINLLNQRKFSSKYKVVTKKEFESMWSKIKNEEE